MDELVNFDIVETQPPQRISCSVRLIYVNTMNVTGASAQKDVSILQYSVVEFSSSLERKILVISEY